MSGMGLLEISYSVLVKREYYNQVMESEKKKKEKLECENNKYY